MLFGMITVIFVGFPISFTLLFLGAGVRRHRAGRRAHLQPRLHPDLGDDEGRGVSRGSAVHLHGLHDRAGRADGAAVRRPAQPAGPGARLALPGGDPDRHDLRHGDGHRRRGGDRAGHHGGADDDQGRLRCAAVRRARSPPADPRDPDSAVGHAGGDGTDHGRAGEPAVLGRLRSRLPAGDHVYRLYARPQLPQSQPRAAGAEGRPDQRPARGDQGGRRRRPAPGAPDRFHPRHDPGRHGDAHRGGGLRRQRRHLAGAVLRQAVAQGAEECRRHAP